VDASYKEIDAAFKSGWYVNLTVEDTGQGIPENIKNRIYEPFFTTKEKGKGTGLGLSLVYGVTKKHNGIILLKSAVKQGAKFEFYFPASDSIITEKKNSISVRAVKGVGTILVVDDEIDLLQTTESILTHLGYKIYGALNGKQAVQIYIQKVNEIDLVLLDYLMPEMDGKIIFQKLKEINPDVKVLICTGYAEQEGLQEVLEKGALGVIPKPYSIETIARKIKKFI
jgi:CheY-like chemotaxis protein